MAIIRIFAWIILVTIFFQITGKSIAKLFKSSPEPVAVLFAFILLMIVEVGIWAAAVGPSELLKKLEHNFKGTLKEISTTFLMINIIPILILVVYLLSLLF